VDEIDSAFSDILSRVENFAGSRSSFGTSDLFNPFSGGDHFGVPGLGSGVGGDGYRKLFERIRTIILKFTRLLTDLNRVGLADDAVAIKQNIIDVASGIPWFEHMFLPRRSTSSPDGMKLEKRIDDLDALVARYEKKTSQFASLSPAEKEKERQSNQKDLNNLNQQHAKLSKKCFYLRNRVEYLLNELHASPGQSSKSMMDKLSVWKKFIENNEYILNQRLTREERETLYSFLRNKLRDVSPDLREAEDWIFE
jgi:hypothetical protein